MVSPTMMETSSARPRDPENGSFSHFKYHPIKLRNLNVCVS